MASTSTFNDLSDIGPQAVAHEAEINEVRQRLGINHTYLDGWIFNFLENKNFNVEEAVAKFQRRAAFEREELATFDINDSMRENMRGGVIQLIGEDKDGRLTFYVNTRRDFPTAKMREERTKIFDMWLSLGTRLREGNRNCRITMLINQKDAGVWKNTDMQFQSSIALRIAKYYPGVVDKMYIVNMGSVLAKCAKPIFTRMPAGVSERIQILTDNDLKRGRLLDLFDVSVLPVELGGQYDCDKQEMFDKFAADVEEYWSKLKAGALGGGASPPMSLKEWEVNQVFGPQAPMATTTNKTSTGTHIHHHLECAQSSDEIDNRGGGLSGTPEHNTEDFITCEEDEAIITSPTLPTCNSDDDDSFDSCAHCGEE